MSERYPGGFITKSPPALNPALGNAAPGIWTMDQVMQAVKNGTWPAYDPYFEYTTLLLHGNGTNGAQNNTFLDASTNNFTITRNGNTTQGSFSPYGSLWSNYFDGDADYLTLGANSAFAFGTGDFTVECWINTTTKTADTYYRRVYMTDGPTGNAGGNFQIAIAPTTGYVNLWDSVLDLLGTTDVCDGSWHHIAAVRSGTTLRLFVDGVQQASTTYSTSVAPNSGSPRPYIGTYNGGEGDFGGHISNLRVVKGTALYTSAFTPSTTPLTAVSGTSLLTCQSNRFIDNSASPLTITVNGSPSVQRFSPFSPTAAYSAATVGGSGYFDGTGDYLTAPDNAAWDVGSSNWTAEAWVFPTASPNQPIIIGQWTSSYAWAMQLSDNSSRNLRGLVYNGSFTDFSGSTPLTLNAWNHCVFTRDGTILRLYLNGVQVATNSFGSGSINTSSSVLSIGADGAGSQPFQGYLSNVRFVNGTCLYPNGTTFTPPTSPLTAITNTQLLCNFTNAGIIDNAMMNDLETVGNAQISTAQSKFGGGSMYNPADTNGAGIRARASGVGTIDGDFTIEWWAYHNNLNTGSNHVMLGPWGINGSPLLVRVDNGSTFQIYMANASRLSISVASSGITATTWQHYAITRSGSTCYAFVSGTQVGTWTMSNSLNFETVSILSENAGTSLVADQMPGYIDDLRITKGYARYTANFTPPTSQLQDQ